MPPSQRFRAVAIGALIAAVVVGTTAAYEVRPGDTLAEIAAEHGTTVSELAELNGIANPNLIRIGQTLQIPGEGGDPSASYVVAAGDSLARIAARHGTTVTALAEANGITNPNLIVPGQKLLIPGSRSAPAGHDESPGRTPSSATVHVVRAGESLASIAARYGTTAEAIAAANGITDPSVIYAGVGLRIGGGETPVITTGAGSTTYVVTVGDTLAEIAARHGTTVDDLVARNGIANANLIRIGQTLEVPGTGGWVCPVDGASYFNDWGFPRSGGRFHEGNDLFASRGAPVRAPVSGTVEQLNGRIGGLQFKLHGDDGHLYIGTHLDGFGAGGAVSAGEVIGYVGDSGNAVGSRPHLHFEVHVDGTPINPYPTLRANGC